MQPDPWILPNKTILCSRLGLSRSTLWGKIEALGNTGPESDNGYDLALWYASALSVGAPVLDPIDVFPEQPKPTPEPSGDSVTRLIGLLMARTGPYSGLLCGDRQSQEIRAQAGDAIAEIIDYHLAAIVAAMPVAQRLELGSPALADLIEWHGAEALGLPKAG